MTKQVRNWKEDMEGCQGLPPTPWQWIETDTLEWIEDANKKLVFGGEISFWDWIGGNVNLEKLFRFFITAPEALPYWLQQYAVEKERADKAEACEQKLREAVEELLSIFDDNGSWHMVEVENGFSYNLSPSDEYVVSFAKKLLASLYPKEEEAK
ncbi:hypothetical protein D3C73_185250 [compost metagenome]|jgi:hypothetical protein